ncbi:hypothetical protein [Streptomyces sp. NPDC021224]|uniref:hypothetical protein n=1 Tax=unclassified Streptomyces TaxID=2593676 RepID=UPI0037B746C6
MPVNRQPLPCGERAALPAELAGAAQRLAPPGSAGPEDVERELRCVLEAHALGDHHAFVLELPRDGAVWTAWTRGRPPQGVTVRADCPGVGPLPAREPCGEFAGHPGAHTWGVGDRG